MGEFRNEYNRKSRPYGGWEFGEDICEEMLRKKVGEQDSLDAKVGRPGASRCTCCSRRFAPSYLLGGVCKPCEEHLRCFFCGVTLPRTADGHGTLCGACHGKFLTFMRSLKGDAPREMAKAYRAYFDRNLRMEYTACPNRRRYPR